MRRTDAVLSPTPAVCATYCADRGRARGRRQRALDVARALQLCEQLFNSDRDRNVSNAKESLGYNTDSRFFRCCQSFLNGEVSFVQSLANNNAVNAAGCAADASDIF